MLRDGRADVGLLHRPQNDLSGLDAEELLVEDQVVVFSERHPLAHRASVCLADLAGETMPRWPSASYTNGTGPLVDDAGQLMQLIALGRIVAVVPESVRTRLHSDLVWLPVADAPTATIVVAWPQQCRSRQVATFVQAASIAARRLHS